MPGLGEERLAVERGAQAAAFALAEAFGGFEQAVTGVAER